MRADRFAQADLAGALGDRHQHDVHDANPADQQRDGGNSTQEDGQHVGDGAGRVEKILLGQDGEIVGADGSAVTGAQDVANLLAGLRHGLGAGGLHHQHVYPVARAAADQAHLCGGQRDDGDIILVREA